MGYTKFQVEARVAPSTSLRLIKSVVKIILYNKTVIGDKNVMNVHHVAYENSIYVLYDHGCRENPVVIKR